MTTPILSMLRPDLAGSAEPIPTDDGVERVLLHLPSTDNAYELVHTTLAALEADDSRVELVLLRTLHLGDHLLPGPLDDSAVERARRSLRPVAQFVEGSGASVVVLACRPRM